MLVSSGVCQCHFQRLSMNNRSISCLWTSVPQFSPAPCNRYKHACCASGGHVYLLGGRDKSTLKDFWKYNVACNHWIQLDCSDNKVPDELEEHSMVAHQGVLYIFGGLGSYSTSKTPLWLFDTVKEQWLHSGKQSSPLNPVPANKKAHSAVVLDSFMYIYGGYIDIRGPSQEFWKLNLDNKEWSLLNNAKEGPGPRYSHSAIGHQDSMYIYGGLQGLNEQSDLWKWNSSNQTWSRLRTWSGPSKLIGHSAVVYKDNMLLFGGGQTSSAPNNCLWRLSLSTEVWEKLPSNAPCRVHHCSVGLGCSFQSSMPSAISSKEPSTWHFGDFELQPVHKKEKTEEESKAPMPDLMLILGGKPLNGQTAISVWYLTCRDN